MDLLHYLKSAGDRGTLQQIKNFFGHRSVKHRVMENYQHVSDFIEVRSFSIDVIIGLAVQLGWFPIAIWLF